MAENIDAELKSTLQRQVPLLRVTPSDSLRRDIASMILDATSSFFKRWNQQVDSLEHPYTAEEALHVLLLSLGRGDAQVRHRVLEMLAVTSQEKCRRILWEFLPFTFPEKPSQTASSEIVKALQSILAKEQATVLPILKALSLLPVDDDSPNETFQIAMDAIPVAEQNQLSALFQIMLVNVASDEDSSSAYQAIRNKICHVETLGDVPSLVSVSGQAVVALRNAFLNESSGGLLAKAFVEQVIQLVQSNPGRCLFFDWAVILTLLEQPSHKKKFEDLFDEWLTGSSFPFAAINRLVSIFCLVSKSDPPVLYTALIRSFMHLSLFLMVAPLRISVPRRTRQTYESVVFDFLLALDDTSQAELLRSIVHLSAELAQGPVELSLRRRRSLSDESVDYACRSVNHILGKLAERSPSILGCFRHVLESRLSGSLFSQSEPSDLKSVSEISNMLSSLAVSGPHSQAITRVPDLMVLLKKLLFPSAETCVDALDDFTIVAKGLILATAMIKTVNLDEDARDTIKKWVLRVILPSTRRMIEPELGSPGLKFLEAWMNEEVNNDTHLVFQHFRKVLSNTGLIQVLSHYQKSKRKYHTVLGYEKTTGLGSSTLPEKENERRHIVFCVTFFLKHFELRNSDRWKHAMAWTFELVDTYLRIGRGKARTNWKPDCWLQAMIEFPKVKLAGHVGSHRSIRIKQWLRKIFEDLNPENFKATEIVVDPNDLLEYLQEVQAIGDIQLFCDEVLFFELSLLVGLAVVAAVLKNSLAHFRWTAPTASTHTRLLTFLQNNFIRLYGMKIKLRFLFVLLKALRSKRLTQMDDYARTRAAEAERTGQNAEHSLFRTSQYLNQVDLWECLTDCRHDIVLKTGIGALKFNTKTESLGDHSFLDVVHLRTCILSHICDQCNGSTLSLLSGSGRECDAKLEKMASTAFLLIDDFPSLRKALWQQDDEQYLLQLKALAVLYLRLFHLVAERHCVDQKPIECSLKFLDRAFHGEDAGHKSQKVLVEQVNQALYKRLADAIDVDIGNNIVELLSLFVARIKGRFVGEVIQANLSFMYTVYDDMDNDAVSVEIGRPRVFQSLLKASITDFTTDRHKALIRAVDTMVSKVSEASDRRDSQVVLRHFQSGLVRHFGLVHFTDSPSKEYVLSASKLITEIDSFLFIFGRKVGLKRDQTHLGDPKPSKRAWASGLPFIPALDGKTFHEMYHSVMRFVIGAAALSDPSSTPSSGVPALGPYVDLAALFQLFGRLIAIYKMNLSVFPRKSFTFVIQDARMMLTVAVVQLNCSVDWRNLQPLLSVVDRRRGQVDLGAMSYFETFLNVVSYNTVGQLWRLAEKMRSDTSNDMSKIAALRAVTDKASRKLKTIANAHNLKAISFESMDEFDGQEKPPLSDPIRGFHLLAAADKAWWNEMSCLPIVGTPRGDASAAKKRSLQDLGSSSDDKNVTEEDLPDQGGDTQSLDSDSFRVAGGWGGDSDGDEDDSVDELLLLVPKLTQHN